MSDVFVGDNDHGDRVPSSEVLLQMIKQLRVERDEARREVCGMNESGLRMNESDKQREAKRRGWDCFKQLDKGQAALDKLALLDEELGLFDMVSEANYNNDLFRKTDME